MIDFNRTDRDYLLRRSYQKWGRWGRDVISLSVADMDYPPPEEVREAVMEWLYQDRTPYGHVQGEAELREALAARLQEANGLSVSEEDILVVPGTRFAIFLACYLSLKPGDEAILTPSPVYGAFARNITAAGATPVAHCLIPEEGFRYHREGLRALVTPRTRLLMVCNPHNPTGRVLGDEDLLTIAHVACENDLMVFSDELYEDMVFEGRHRSIAALGPEVFQRTLTVFGFSKAFGIPGYRIAYMVVPPALKQNVIEASSRIIIHADTLAQAAAMGALKAGKRWLEPYVRHLQEMRDRALERMRAIPGILCHRPQAAPFLFPDVRGFGLPSKDLARHLLDKGKVVVQPGSDFGPGGEGFIRLTLATSWDILAQAFERMEHALAGL